MLKEKKGKPRYVMWKMPLLQCKSEGSVDKAICSLEYHSVVRALPEDYMSEYSVVGLLVDDRREAVRVLSEQHFRVTPEMEVLLDGPSQLDRVVRVLADAGITWEIADTVGGVYQG